MKYSRLFLAVIVVFFSMTVVNAEDHAVSKDAKPKEKAKSKSKSQKHGEKSSAEDDKAKLENTLYLQLKDGRVVIELMPDVAPKHVARIKELARSKFYDGIVFHRVIDGFMAQTGDPTGTGMGGSDKPNLDAEFSTVQHDKGIVSMARANDPNSANSQFFIVLEESHFLDGKYTVWGKVTDGMEFVNKIKKGDSRKNGSVENPDKIISLSVAADVKE